MRKQCTHCQRALPFLALQLSRYRKLRSKVVSSSVACWKVLWSDCRLIVLDYDQIMIRSNRDQIISELIMLWCSCFSKLYSSCCTCLLVATAMKHAERAFAQQKCRVILFQWSSIFHVGGISGIVQWMSWTFSGVLCSKIFDLILCLHKTYVRYRKNYLEVLMRY